MKTLINQTLKELKVMSFYYEKELLSNIVKIYIKFDDWIEIVADEGKTTIETTEVPQSIIDEECEWIIKDMENLLIEKKIKGKKLIDIKKLFLKENHNFTYGIILFFETGKCMCFHDNSIKEDGELIFNINNLPKDLEIK